MKKFGILAAIVSAFALAASASPAHAGQLRVFQNELSSKCLNGAPSLSKPVMSACGPNARWDLTNDSRGTKLMVAAGIKCLDSDGTHVYLSPCNDATPGQRWNVHRDSDGIMTFITQGDKYLTAWNDGSLTMARTSEVDSRYKYMWS
ncbi:ricin-type beta-trefoil lectin domain protein [Streptomyces sp. NPDC098781]|uniref:ricin-type beta-trefoil lectin domain protein n=1 Tax=Streptomyces sp. NPDC098781 TaxID=3366097 RepID=UPI00382924E6